MDDTEWNGSMYHRGSTSDPKSVDDIEEVKSKVSTSDSLENENVKTI